MKLFVTVCPLPILKLSRIIVDGNIFNRSITIHIKYIYFFLETLSLLEVSLHSLVQLNTYYGLYRIFLSKLYRLSNSLNLRSSVNRQKGKVRKFLVKNCQIVEPLC